MNIFGVLAQLTRALDLHSRGREFESHILHQFYSMKLGTFHSFLMEEDDERLICL